MRNRKKIKRKKQIKLYNKKLCKKYPWLIPNAHYYSGRILKKRDWDYSWTWYGDMPRGWRKCFGKMMLEELDVAIRKAGLTDIYGLDQVKEKYGRLCWFHHGFNDEIDQIATKYEYISTNVCIYCGQPDVPMVNDGWISPFCWECFFKKEHKREKWCGDNYPNYKPLTDEQIRKNYLEMTSDEESDWKICDSYTIRRYSKEGSSDKVYNISDTVAKIRRRYDTQNRRPTS